MSRLMLLAALLLASSQLMLAWGCAARPLNSADRDAPLTSIEETSRFRELLTTALEREALYTLVGGLKPLSTGFWQGEMTVEGADLAELVSVRRALAPLRDEIYYADVQVFATAHDGKRTIEAYVVHRASLAAMIDREPEFWSPIGIAPCTHPAEVVAVVDRLPRARSPDCLSAHRETARSEKSLVHGSRGRNARTQKQLRRFGQNPDSAEGAGRGSLG